MIAMTEWIDLFVKAENYRHFLGKTVEYFQTHIPYFSLASFCKKSGIKSRSLLIDIKNHRRRVTSRNINLIAKGFEFPTEVAQLFKYMVAIEESDLVPDMTVAELKTQYKKLLDRMIQKNEGQDDKDDRILQKSEWLLVYAALGDASGATFTEILKRTKLPRMQLREILDHFRFKQIVIFKNQRYICHEQNAKLFYKLAFHDNYKNLYQEILQKQIHKSETQFSSPEHLFSLGFFAIFEKDLPQLKKKIQKMMREYVLESEKSNGDRVAILNMMLTLS